jgi:hypothetical protein
VFFSANLLTLATRPESDFTFSVAAAWEGVNFTSLPASFQTEGAFHTNNQFTLSIAQFSQAHHFMESAAKSNIHDHFQIHIAAKVRSVFFG